MSRPNDLAQGESVHGSPMRLFAIYLVEAWIIIFWLRFFLTVLPGVGTGELDRIDILLAVPEILWSNLYPEETVNNSSSWGNLVQRLPILGYAAIILIGAYSLGRLSLSSMKLGTVLDRFESIAIACGVGLSFVSLFTLGLGLCGVLSRGLFFVFLLSVITLYSCLKLRQRQKKLQRSNRSTKRDVSLRNIVIACLIFLGPMLLGALLPSTDFDVKEYHLEGPKEYFLAGRVHFLPHNVYTSFPFLTEMLTLCGMVLTNDWFTGALVGKAVLFAFAPLTALGIYSVGKRVANSTAGALGALIYLSTPWAYRISIIAYTEGAMCCYVVLSLLALLIWLERINCEDTTPSQRRILTLLLGLLAGSSIATKYPGMVMVAIPVALVLLGAVVVRRIPLRESLIMAGMYSMGGIITFGPWVAKNCMETGNPVYPLMYSVFGGEDWDEELNAKWKEGHARPAPLIQTPLEMAQELKKYTVDVCLGSVWQSPLMFGLAPLVLLYRQRGSSYWIVIGAAATLLAVWYSMTHLIDRFWVPVLPIIAVLSGVGCVVVHEIYRAKNRSGSLLSLLLSKSLAGFFVVTLIYNFAFMTTPASGNNAYLMEYKTAREVVKPASVSIAEEAVGKTGRVLFVGEAMVFDADYEYRYNTVFDYSLLEQWTAKKVGEGEWEINSAEEINQKLRDEGITHILVNWNEILRYRTTYGYTDYVSPARFAELNSIWTFEEVQLPASFNLRDWETLPDSWKSVIDNWGPELKQRTATGQAAMVQYQLFQLNDRG